MAIVLALLSAVGYGTSDFLAGLAGRDWTAELVAGTIVAVELACAAVAVVFVDGAGPQIGAIAWGAASGLGGAAGTLALYRGLTRGAMTEVASVSAVLAAVGPVLVGLALGERLHPLAAVGIVIAVPAIALVCIAPGDGNLSPSTRWSGLLHGLLAGGGFALLFVALDRAGTRSGAWPVLAEQIVSLLVLAPLTVRGARSHGRPPTQTGLLTVLAGLLAGSAALLFLAATGRGELSIVAVVASLYPAFTVLLARSFLDERWSAVQATGLALAVVAIVLVSI